MRSFESNLAYVQACLAEMQDYERAAPMFWTLSARPPAGSPPFLQMTIGNVLLAMDEIRAVDRDVTPAQRAAYLQLTAGWEAAQTTSGGAFARKATQELHSRISLWAAYLGELAEGHGAEEYPGEIRHRVLAERLQQYVGPDWAAGSQAEKLRGLDGNLQARWSAGKFVWAPPLAAIYPARVFWFLYGRPRTAG